MERIDDVRGGEGRWTSDLMLISLLQLDSKSSPLAMLAKTCSQIGADTGPVRPAGSGGTSTTGNSGRSNGSSSSAALGNGGDAIESKNEDAVEDLSRSRSTSSSAEIRVTVDTGGRDPKRTSPPPRLLSSSGSSSLSPASNLTSGSPLANATSPPRPAARSDTKTTSSSSTTTTSTPKINPSSSSSSSGSSPIIRSGLEVLAGYPGDVPLGTLRRPGDGSGVPPHLSALGDMKNLMAAGALPPRPPPMFLGAAASSSFSSTQFLQAAGLLPASSSSVPPSPPSSAACRDPLCRDPTCPTSLWSHHRLASSAAAAAAACRTFTLGCSSYSPAVIVQQQQHREALMAAAIARAASSQSTSSSTGPAGGPLPYVCNWVAGRCIYKYRMLRQRRAEFPECKGRASSSRCRLLRPQVCYKRGPSYPPEDTHQPVDLRPRGPGCHCRRRRRRDINGVFVVIVDSSIPVSPLRPPRQRRPATLAVSRGTLLLVPAARHRRLPEPLRDHCGRGRGGCLVIPVPLCAAASDVKSVPCRSPHLLMQRRPRPAAEDDAVAIFKAKERKRRGMRDMTAECLRLSQQYNRHAAPPFPLPPPPSPSPFPARPTISQSVSRRLGI